MKLKSLPIAIQLWTLYSIVAASVIACLCMLPFILSSFFNNQVFDLLLDAQKNMQVIAIPHLSTAKSATVDTTLQLNDPGVTELNPATAQAMAINISQTPATMNDSSKVIIVSTTADDIFDATVASPTTSALSLVSHCFFSKDINSIPLPKPFSTRIFANAASQTGTQQTYSSTYKGKTLLYAIKKLNSHKNNNGYLVSYAWSTYSSNLTSTLLIKLIPLMLAIIALILLPGAWFARSITKPLKTLEKHYELVTQENQTPPINLHRNDEIGKLADKFNEMRIQLAQQEITRQEYLQNITHDLRTPLMVIRAYAESIIDGIHPIGSPEDSALVIANESDRMIEKVNNIVLLNRLNFLRTLNEKQLSTLPLDIIVSDTVARISCLRSNLQIHSTLHPTTICGDEEQLTIMLSNILENMVRYAENTIDINLHVLHQENDKEFFTLTLWNDGLPFESNDPTELFEPFTKGAEGKFGLGLSIAKKIALYHGFTITAQNPDAGACIILSGQCSGCELEE